MRGVDEGLTGGAVKSEGKGSSAGSADTTVVGESQLDYIRRAEIEMAFVSQQREAKGQQVSAVGILGTDNMKIFGLK